jgi:hypothetical protein
VELRLPGALVTLSVQLSLGGGVRIADPELWQHDGRGFVRLPGPAVIRDGALWRGVPRIGAGGAIVLQVYWSALDPLNGRCRYPAQIEVRDQAGEILAGRNGHVNPTVLPCDLGVAVPSWDHREQSIVISA